jgi:hypothetical protein
MCKPSDNIFKRLWYKRHAGVRHTAILGQSLYVVFIVAVTLLIQSWLPFPITASFFICAIISIGSIVIGTYLGVFLKAEQVVNDAREFVNEDKRCIMGCKITCEDWEDHHICTYDYTHNALLLPYKIAQMVAKIRKLPTSQTLNLRTPVEVIINKDAQHYTITVSSPYEAYKKVEKFKKGGELERLGFIERGFDNDN